MAMTNAQLGLSLLKKKYKDVYDTSYTEILDQKQIPHTPTGSIILDNLIGGTKVDDKRLCPGWPKGKIIECYGHESSGKSTIAMHFCAQILAAGGSACYVDLENSFSHGYAKNMGIDTRSDRFTLLQPYTFEDTFNIIEVMVEAKVDGIVIDSVSGLIPKAVFEAELGTGQQVDSLPKLMSQNLKRIVQLQRKCGSVTTVFFVNQVRDKIKASKYDTGPNEDTSGGRALKFYAALRIKLRRKAIESATIRDPLTGESSKQAISNVIQVTGIKNKIDSRQNHTALMNIRYGHGIDNYRSIMDIAILRKIITKYNKTYLEYRGSSPAVSFGRPADDGSFTPAFGAKNGIEQCRAFLIANPPIFKDILVRVMDYLSTGVQEISSDMVESEEFETQAVGGQEDLDADNNNVPDLADLIGDEDLELNE